LKALHRILVSSAKIKRFQALSNAVQALSNGVQALSNGVQALSNGVQAAPPHLDGHELAELGALACGRGHVTVHAVVAQAAVESNV